MLWLPPSQESSTLQPVATPVRRPAANGVCLPRIFLHLKPRQQLTLPAQFDATPDTAPPAYSSPSDDTTIADDTALISQDESIDPRQEPETTQTTQATAYSVPAVAAHAIKTAAAETYEELKDQLAKAEATISTLKNEVASGLRQRKATAATASDDKSKAAQQPQLAQAERAGQQGTEGVPVQIVAVLCLASFLLAYFFF